MAIACLGLVTFFPEPLRSLPRLNSCISLSTFLPADGEYFRPEEDFFDEDLRLLLLDFFLLEELFLVLLLLRAVDFFALDFFLAEDFFALLFFAEDFFVLLDFFFAAFFVAMTILPRTQMFPSFEAVVWYSGNAAQNIASRTTQMRPSARESETRMRLRNRRVLRLAKPWRAAARAVRA
jgi:hypothetical protein